MRSTSNDDLPLDSSRAKANKKVGQRTMRVAMKKQQSKNIIFSIDMKVQGSKDTKDNVSGPSDDGMNKRGSQINLMQINYKKK